MKDRTIIILAIFGLATVFGGLYFWSQAQKAAVAPVEADGEWDTIYAPDEVAGTDLSITKTSISADADYSSGGAGNKLAMNYDINGTDGTTHQLAFGVEVSSNRIDDADIEFALDSVNTSQVAISEAFIVPDEEGINLDSSNAVYTADVPTEQDEATFDISSISEGDYVTNVDLKAISTSGIGSGDTLLTYDFDGSTDGDVDAFTGTINNG